MGALLKFDLRSLLIVLSAFIGNAQIFGVDLVLAILALAFFVQLPSLPRTSRVAPLSLLFFIAILLVVALRAESIGIPYFEAYGLWPIKALCLMLLVGTGRTLVWPTGNMIALATICLALIAVGEIEGGRLVSVFGPNMLYRLFGFLMIFGFLLLPLRRGQERLWMITLAIIGLFASLLTGSSGALLTIAVVLLLASLRYSKKLSVVLGAVCVSIVFVFGPTTAANDLGFGQSTSFSRVNYKLTNLEASERLVGWGEMLTQPLTLLGYDHADFWYLWSYGYQYPHNLLIELVGFYGLVGIVLAITVLVSVARAIPNAVAGDVLSMTLIILAIGSMLSGDLSDNFGVISLACGMAIRRWSKGTSNQEMKVARRPNPKNYSRQSRKHDPLGK